MRQRHSWRVQRTGVMAPTGQQRWDQAYQLLLRWATTDQAAPAGSPVAVGAGRAVVAEWPLGRWPHPPRLHPVAAPTRRAVGGWAGAVG